MNIGHETVDGATRRDLFRLAAENRLIEDAMAWMRYHAARNNTSHNDTPAMASEVYTVSLTFTPAATALLATLATRND